MPMKPITVKANFQLDTSAARAQLQGLQRELSSITKGATMDLGITSQITQAIREAQQLKQVLAEATDFSTGAFDLSKFDAAIKQQGKTIAEFKQSLQTLGPEGEKAFNSLATTIASAQVPLKRTSQGIQQMMTAFGNTMRWQATSMAMHKIVGTFQQAFNYAQNLDKSLTNIQIVTGHNADYMRNFAREANKAAQALSASTLEYTNASLIYYQQGLGDKEVQKRAETTLKLAKVTGESASKVSQQMTAVWNNFSNGVDNLERYADVMTALGATTASSSSEIAKGLEKFASVTKTIGLSYDYAASALATVTAQTRQSADSVGTAFKTLFSRLESLNLGETLDDSVTLNKYSEALLKVGVNVMDASGKLKNMDNILDELGGKWNNLNKAQQVALAQTVGGVRNYTSLITLMDNWDKFQTNLVTSQLAEGTLQHQADIYAQSWEAAQQRVKTASQGIYDTLISSNFFKGFNNAFAGVLNFANKAGSTLGSFGSTAGIMNLFLAGNKDAVAKGIDNFVVNTLGQTRFGQNIFKQQQTDILKDLTENVFDTGSSGSIMRKEIFETLQKEWSQFDKRNYATKQDALVAQNLLSMRTEQARSLMNDTIDAEQALLRNNMNQKDLMQSLSGSWNIGLTNKGTANRPIWTVDQQEINKFLNPIFNGSGNYQIGFSKYIEQVFGDSIEKLAAMDLDNASESSIKALTGKIQAQAINALTNADLKNAIEKDAALADTIKLMQTGNLRDEQIIKRIQAGLLDYGVRQTKEYEAARAALDKEFMTQHPDAVKTDSTGKQVIDSSTEKGAAYLEKMNNAKTVAEEAYAKHYITKQQAEDMKNGNLPRSLMPTKQETTSFGNAAVSAGQLMNSMAMAANSINNFAAQIREGTATGTGLLTAMGSTTLALGQFGNIIGNTTKIAGLGGLSVSSLGWITAAIAAVGFAGFEIYQRQQAKNLESKVEYTNENKIASVAQAKEDQQKYEQFLPVMKEQQQAIDKLTSLQQGTREYTAQLIASNNSAREIIENYGLKAGIDYSIDSSGAYIFTADQIKNINNTLQDQAMLSSTYSQLGISAYNQLSNILTIQDYNKEIEKIEQQAKQRTELELTEDIAQEVLDATDMSGDLMPTVADTMAEREAAFAADLVDFMDMGTNANTIAAADVIGQVEPQYTAQEQQDIEDTQSEISQLNLISKGDYQASLNAMLSSFKGLTPEQRMAVIALGEDPQALEKYQQKISEIFSPSSLTRNAHGNIRSEDELAEAYQSVFHRSTKAGMTAADMASEIENYLLYEFLDKEILGQASDLHGPYISDFVSINERSYSDMVKLFDQIASDTKLSEDDQKIYNTFIQKALTDSVKAQDNLVQAMMNNQQFQGVQFLEIAKSLQEVEEGANLSTTQLETATNYLNNFTNNFGDAAGKAVFDALTNNQKGWNQDYYEALQKISLDNSISALADLTHFTGLGVNADLAEPLGNLRKAILEDIDDRGGLAKTLFTSSEFTKVFDSLTEQYKVTGEITAQNIADLAKKNEIIGDYMTVTGSNEQAIADMMEMISSGNITAEGITPAIEHFVQRASGAAGAQQEALDVVAEQDLSDSITNMDKWAQNIGKAWYVGRTNDVLGDRPVLEGLKMILTPEDYAEYLRILNTGAYGGTTSSMLSDMKGSMANAYAMLSELEGTKKKKGKGGGGMDTVYEYLAKEGIFDENGIGLDEKTGRFTLGADFGEKFGKDKLVTFSSLKEYIIESLTGSAKDEKGQLTGYQFKGKGYTRSQAEDMATMMIGSMSAASMGTVLSQSGLIDAAQTFFGEISANGEKQGNYITNEQYNALFDQYSDVLALMKMEETKDENGKTTYKLREATQEELANKDYGVNIDQWRAYFTQEAKKVGAAIIGIKGQSQLSKADAKEIGIALAKESQETLKATQGKETEAIVKAAVAAGVQTYQDYTWFRNEHTGGEGLGEYKGQSLDYDQLQNFYNNVLGLSTELLNTHLETIVSQNDGLAFTHKYTDAYGVEHNINSRDYATTGEFTRAIEQENEFSNIVLEYQRAQWVQQYFDTEREAGRTGTYEGAMEFLRKMTAQETAKAQAEAEKTTQSVPEGGETTPPEGGEETPPEGEGTANVTGTTGVVTTPEGAYNTVGAAAQKAVGKYSNYTYRGSAADEKVYKYNLLHPTLTPLQAYNAVNSGNVDVDAEWNKKYSNTATEEDKEQQEQRDALKAYEEEQAIAAAAAEEDQEQQQQREAFKAYEEAQAIAAADLGFEEGGAGVAEARARKEAEKQAAIIAAADLGFEEGGAGVTEARARIEARKEAEREAARTAAQKASDAIEDEKNGMPTDEERANAAAFKILDANPEWMREFTASPLHETAAQFVARRQQEEAEAKAAREQAALVDVNNLINEANKIEPTILGPNGEVISGPGAEEAARTAMMTPSQYEAYQAQQENIKKAAESLGISTEEASRYINSGFNGTYDAYKQYSNIATFNSDKLSAQQRLDFINATYEKAQKDITSLTPFEKQVLTMIGEIDDNTGTLVEHGEEEGDAATRARNGHQVTEEGEILDENGNPIQFDQNGNPVSSGSGNGTGGDNGGTTGGPGGRSGEPNANEVKAAGGAFVQGLLNGQFGNPDSKTFTFGGQVYSIVRQNGVILGYNPGTEAADPGSDDYIKVDDAATNVDLGGNASGQNNARLLAYASGKKGHIAITGELGPELRVKSDGSMDILGKKGREYAWVDPDDRIYTASQSAGILKSNKIPELEGLAKGINNFIPGYFTGGDAINTPISTDQGSSGSGGGGRGGGGRSRGGGGAAATEKDPRYDPQTLKIRDVMERYYTILQQIDNITKAVERFSKVADRAWGRERIRAIERQTDMERQQYEAQKKYLSEIKEYLDTDQSTLTTMIREFVDEWNKAVDENTDPNKVMEKVSWAGAEFDNQGVLTNYREFVEKLTEQYNLNAASANQEVQFKFQEQLKDIQFYTDTLNLYEEQKDALEDIKNAILDSTIKAISYEVEYKLELSGDVDRILNFQADKYKDDVYQAAKYLELLDQRADLTRKNLEAVSEGIMKTIGAYAGESMRVGAFHDLEELGVYGTERFELDKDLLDEIDEDDEEALKELEKERSRNITKQLMVWMEEARADHQEEVDQLEKLLEFSEEEGAGDFTYDYNWRDTYDTWEQYYDEVINKTDNDTERFISNYDMIIRRLNGLVDYTKVRAQVGEWLEELRVKDAQAAAEIDKIIRRTEDGQIANYGDVINKLNEANQKLNDEMINLMMTDQEAFFDKLTDFIDNPGWVDFTTEHKDLLTNYMDQIYQYLNSIQDTYNESIEMLGDHIKQTSKQMDSAVDEFDYYSDVYKEFENIINLTNRDMTDISKEFFNNLNNKVMDNNINKIKATVTNYHLLENELADVTAKWEKMQQLADAATGKEQEFLQRSADQLKEQMDLANSQFEDAHKAYLSAWEDALSKMAEVYKSAVEEASKNFEKGFSPLFNTLALLQAQFDRERALGDLYVDNYQRIHDLNKLNRDIESSIIDTDNLKGKERLRDLQKEINDLQEDGTELSEYDLDILDKKYKLELARQALEDAKDAKSMVRLARDNNGNWSYVYTANQDDVDKAEQEYEDAIREMEQANEDYIENIQDQIVQVQQQAQEAILSLQPEDFATYDDYLNAVQAIQSSMYQTLDYLRSQMNNAFGNNIWLDPYIVDRYGANDHNLTDTFGNTILANLLDNDNLDKAIDNARKNFTDSLMSPALQAYLEYSQRQQEVYQAAEHNMATIGRDFGDEMNDVAKLSNEQVNIVEKLSNRIETAYNDMAATVEQNTAKHLAEIDKLVNRYEKLVEVLTKVKEISGENLPVDLAPFVGRVDSWRDIEDLNRILAERGEVRVFEDLTGKDTKDLMTLEEKLKDATDKISEWMTSLLVDTVEEETRTEIEDMIKKDENGYITNYRQVISKLGQLEQTDENKEILKELRKWQREDQDTMLKFNNEYQNLKEGEGLYTNLGLDDEFTKEFLRVAIDNLIYKQKIDVGDNGVNETEKSSIYDYLDLHGGVWVVKGDTEMYFDNKTDFDDWYKENAEATGGGGGGGSEIPYTEGPTYWDTHGYGGHHWDTGGYTGHWQSADTGMYTGEWPSGSVRRNGRLAWLHQKELVLNAHDTENFLDAMKIVRQLDNLTSWMANGLGDLMMPKVTTESGELEQNVHIEAEFPNVTDHNEIEQAFNNLVNMASQYANRK